MEVTQLTKKLKELERSKYVDWATVAERVQSLDALKTEFEKLDENPAFKKLKRQIKALNHPVRIKILIAIKNGAICPCELEYVTGLSQATISHHLSLLEDAELISRIREGKRVFLAIKNAKIIDTFLNVSILSNKELFSSKNG